MRADRVSVERLLDIGRRMSALRRADKLQTFLIDEAAALSGARRVLLVIDSLVGFEIAGARLPRGEDRQLLLQAVTPWLEEARRERCVRLRHGPEGAKAIEQRSCLVAPLIAQEMLLGYLYADVDGAYGRFDETDRDLLGLLTTQAAAVLANVRMVEETREALARQTATAEILTVISQSPTDVRPVFQAIAERARVLCKSDVGATTRLIDGIVHLAGVDGMTAEGEEIRSAIFPMPPVPP